MTQTKSKVEVSKKNIKLIGCAICIAVLMLLLMPSNTIWQGYAPATITIISFSLLLIFEAIRYNKYIELERENITPASLIIIIIVFSPLLIFEAIRRNKYIELEREIATIEEVEEKEENYLAKLEIKVSDLLRIGIAMYRCFDKNLQIQTKFLQQFLMAFGHNLRDGEINDRLSKALNTNERNGNTLEKMAIKYSEEKNVRIK